MRDFLLGACLTCAMILIGSTATSFHTSDARPLDAYERDGGLYFSTGQRVDLGTGATDWVSWTPGENRICVGADACKTHIDPLKDGGWSATGFQECKAHAAGSGR